MWCIEKHVLVKKIFANGLYVGLARQAWVGKTVHRVERHWLSGKEKVPGAVVSKEGHADSLLNLEKCHVY